MPVASAAHDRYDQLTGCNRVDPFPHGFDSAKTLSAFALGLVLFFFTLALNYIALKVVQRYREQYD